MVFEWGIIWYIFMALLSPLAFILNILITSIITLVMYYIYLFRKKIYCNRSTLKNIICNFCLCSTVLQWAVLITSMIIGLFADGLLNGVLRMNISLATEFSFISEAEAVANHVYGVIVIIASILVTYNGYKFVSRKLLDNDKDRKIFCWFCALLSGGTVFPLSILLIKIKYVV